MSVAETSARPLRADAQRNRDAILAAARRVFADRGRELVMEDVAREACVGVGTLYRHFPRRIDLVEAVYRGDVDALVAASERALELDDPFAGLSAWLEAFVEYAESKRTLLTELREAFERQPDLRTASRERMVAALGAVLERAQAAGAVRDDVDASDVLTLVGGMCTAPAVTPEQTERLLALVLTGLRTAPPA